MDRTTFINEHHARFGIAEQQLVETVKDATGQHVVATQRVIRGDEYEVHRIHQADGSTVYLRAAWPDAPAAKAGQEAAAMQHARAGGVPVPETLALALIESDDGDRAAMVMREATGRQLGSIAAQLSSADRATVMRRIGRTLQDLHAMVMPGAGRPDVDGRWEDPETKRRGYIKNVLDDSRHLIAAGLTAMEVDRAREIVQAPIVPLEDPPVLCHGDLSPEHVFVDDDLQVVGVIDWGMWCAGSATSELAGIAMAYPEDDLDSIFAGHGFVIDAESRNQLCWHMITQAIGEARWLVTSGQGEELDAARSGLRTALQMIDN